MSATIRVSELASIETAGMWVPSADRYQPVLPEPEAAPYIVTQTIKGVSELAVRGYNDGKPLALERNQDSNFGVTIGDKTYYSGLGFHKKLLAVPTARCDEFDTAIRRPNPKTIESAHKIVEVLEQGITGNWDLWCRGGLYDDPDYVYAEVMYPGAGSNIVGLVDYSYNQKYGFFERGDAPVKPARIVVDGPEYTFVPNDGSHSLVRANAVADRITSSHWVTGQPLGDEEHSQLTALHQQLL